MRKRSLRVLAATVAAAGVLGFTGACDDTSPGGGEDGGTQQEDGNQQDGGDNEDGGDGGDGGYGG
ncbi:hypothetical protein SAMN05421810_102357 [Amycolatopsis arida]|uniref:Uncharacterized protein n=1 Tax=Amycolatopsis arida TaxID=587909 RepID=A0A1I5PPI8_9PSEU|nr:hypothetical protein CLV69_101357 [Amycolatopsis arida]SFP35993.1 hypothetical protein SAMN05421810_102357 [Amycolatopsis arida]